jgi:hypothetical protein
MIATEQTGICRICRHAIYRWSDVSPWRTVIVDSCDTASCATPDGDWINDGHIPEIKLYHDAL